MPTQFGGSFGRQPRRLQGCLRLLQAGLRAVVLGAVETVIEVVQYLPGGDIAALGEQAPLDDAADLRTHFGDQVGAGASGQASGQGHRLVFQCDHGDLRRGAARCLVAVATASDDRSAQCYER